LPKDAEGIKEFSLARQLVMHIPSHPIPLSLRVLCSKLRHTKAKKKKKVEGGGGHAQ